MTASTASVSTSFSPGESAPSRTARPRCLQLGAKIGPERAHAGDYDPRCAEVRGVGSADADRPRRQGRPRHRGVGRDRAACARAFAAEGARVVVHYHRGYQTFLFFYSSYYSNYDFYNDVAAAQFPPIILYDKKFDQLRQDRYTKMRAANPTADTTLVKSAGETDAENYFRSVYFITDTMAFRSSYSYRTILWQYIDRLARDIYNRKLGRQIVTTIGDYHAWLRSIISQEVLVNWLVAGKVQGEIMHDGANMSTQELQKQLAYIGDKALQQKLTAAYYLYNKLRPGSTVPATVFLDQKNKKISLEAYRGKYVYINFWDSYCAPCIHDIKQYSRLVADKYAGRNIVILYLSLDENDKLWRQSLQQYKPVGINGRAGEGWLSQLVKDYNISYVPRHVIIAPDGTIINVLAGGLESILSKDPFQ